MALFGGVYLTCMIGLLPDKQQETYERFFAMVSAYLDTNDLPNNFEGHFFMTDFEGNIRSSFNLFWLAFCSSPWLLLSFLTGRYFRGLHIRITFLPFLFSACVEKSQEVRISNNL